MTAPARPQPQTAPGAAWTYQDAYAAVQRAARDAFVDAAGTPTHDANGVGLAAGARAYRNTTAPDHESAYNANAAYLAGDHWQDGAPWLGPRGGPLWDAQVKDAVHRQFVPVDVIGEVLDRVANALLKVEAGVSFVGVKAVEEGSEAARAQEAEAAAMLSLVSAWWDRVRLWESARLAVKRARALRRGVLQLWIPRGHLTGPDRDRMPTGLSLSDALARIELAAPAPEHAAILVDPDTQQRYAVFLTERGGERVALVWVPVVREGKVVSMDVREIPERGQASTYTLPLSRLPLSEMLAPLLITESVRRQQAQLNFGSSLLGRLMETAGFAERYIFNAEPAGEWSRVAPDGEPLSMYEDEGGPWYLHPSPRTLGAATTTELIGIKTERVNAQGSPEEVRATPGVHIKEPTSPEGTIAAKREIRASILESCKQAHVLANGETTVSGYSREQARAEFEDDLAGTKAPLEGMLRDLIESVIAWALAMAGGADKAAGIGPNFLDRYRVVVTAHADSGPLSPEERRMIREEFAANLRSRASALSALGMEDVKAEGDAIDAEPEARFAEVKRLLETLAALGGVVSYEAAVRLLTLRGLLTKKEAAALQGRDTDGLVDGDTDLDAAA